MKCFECGGDAKIKHHVIPRVFGGTQTVTLCPKCEAKVHFRRAPLDIPRLTKAALAHKKAKGERIGKVPFGFDLADNGVDLVANAGEQKTISEIHTLRTAGYSLRAIAGELTARGILTKQGTATWKHTTIKRILDRQAA